jgi:hypothetical protein
MKLWHQMLAVRTTLSLDGDVERLIRDEAHRRGKSLKVILNDAVRRGVADQASRVAQGLSSAFERRTSLRNGLQLKNFLLHSISNAALHDTSPERAQR